MSFGRPETILPLQRAIVDESGFPEIDRIEDLFMALAAANDIVRPYASVTPLTAEASLAIYRYGYLINQVTQAWLEWYEKMSVGNADMLQSAIDHLDPPRPS